jgi:hypothetical protein
MPCIKQKLRGEIVLHFKPCSIKCNAELLIKLMKQCLACLQEVLLENPGAYMVLYAYKKLLIQERKGRSFVTVLYEVIMS